MEFLEWRFIDEKKEPCPPSWCPLEDSPGCCHECEFVLDINDFSENELERNWLEELYCLNPDASPLSR